jgi:hypothetical protein
VIGVAIAVNMALFFLPSNVLNIKLKKLDLLADVRVTSTADNNEDKDLATTAWIDELPVFKNNNDSLNTDSGVRVSNPPSSGTQVSNPPSSETQVPNPPHQLDTPQSAPQKPAPDASSSAEIQKSDYLTNTNIIDFTTGRTGLRRFFEALDNIKSLQRPVRIAFLGDSFIEGDIMVADLREKLQQHFGGNGVGFIPIVSHVSQFRPTVKQNSSGWNVYSIIKDKKRKYVLSGMEFTPATSKASVEFKLVDTEDVSSLKVIYACDRKIDLVVEIDGQEKVYELPASKTITQAEVKGNFSQGKVSFRNALGLKVIGLALENNQGVIVDNFSLRGNSGIVMSELDSESCRQLQRVRPYDLIVLQYGLNVASDSILNYSWYRNRMITVVEHIQSCFPGADIMLTGVSDRSHKDGADYNTMPAVPALIKAQWQTAKEAEITFWSIFAAMGGRNSMVKFVEANWASKDYTHLSFRGGKMIADALYNAILTEKGLYDDEEE